MTRHTFLAAVAAAMFGMVIGGLAVYAFAAKLMPISPPRLSPGTDAGRADVLGESLDWAELLGRAKPKDAKFVVEPGGKNGQTRYGYDGYRSCIWEGPTDPAAVREVVFKDIEARFQAKKWETYRGNAFDASPGGDASIASYELHYHTPDHRAAGWVRLFLHREGTRVGAVIVFNTGNDWPSE